LDKIHLARAEGAKGFCLFNLDRNTAETIVPRRGPRRYGAAGGNATREEGAVSQREGL